MISRNVLRGIAFVVWTAVALTALNRAVSTPHSVRASAHRDGMPAGCSDLKIQFENRAAVVESEERAISKSEASTLRVQAEFNGALQVEGWDGPGYSVTLCKAADPASHAEELLSRIHLTFQNAAIGVSGPGSREHWAAHLLIKAPQASSLDLQVNNGPLGLYHVAGTAKVHAHNGPVTISDFQGDLDLSAQNGPITLERNRGKLRVDAENGPVTVSLEGNSWTGTGIEASAKNGPLTLRIPDGYQSGVLVESDGHGPFRCHASACSGSQKNWDDDRKSIHFGSGPTLIHLTTRNGPITVD